MLDPRLISVVPLLCALACTASYPDARDEPAPIAFVEEEPEAAPMPSRPPVPPPPSAPTSESTALSGDGGLVGSGGPGTRVDRGGYSGGRGWENFGRGTRVPTVRQARPEVEGTYDKDVIRRVVRGGIPDVKRCYDLVLARDPNAKGRVTIAFEIDARGKVPTASVQESTMKVPDAAVCIAAAVTGWKFPRPRSGAVKVVQPFALEPG